MEGLENAPLKRAIEASFPAREIRNLFSNEFSESSADGFVNRWFGFGEGVFSNGFGGKFGFGLVLFVFDFVCEWVCIVMILFEFDLFYEWFEVYFDFGLILHQFCVWNDRFYRIHFICDMNVLKIFFIQKDVIWKSNSIFIRKTRRIYLIELFYLYFESKFL